ncbi:MAG: ABC transporter ATP-binding protein [Clostridia bacterium]|nr:ABC transporter ATP-binding protein [Clostridia bacterium]
MLIEIKNIKKNYGKKTVLSDISLKTEGGKCIGIIGGNGCGKSTLFSILAGVNKAKEGQFLLDGQDLLKNTRMRSSIVGYVPQGTPLIEELTAYDNLLLWYEKERMEKELSGGVLGMLGINDFLKVPVCKMSGGMKKRLAIGCAISNKPKILLLDEPSAALDIVCKEKIAEYLKSYKTNGGVIFLATHEVHELEMCDEIFIMRQGVLHPYEFDGNISKLAGSL